MGGREHSVLVDSESWTKTYGGTVMWFIPKWTHSRGNSERQKTTRGTWCAGMRRRDIELSDSDRFTPQMRNFSVWEWLHTSCTSLYLIPLQFPLLNKSSNAAKMCYWHFSETTTKIPIVIHVIFWNCRHGFTALSGVNIILNVLHKSSFFKS